VREHVAEFYVRAGDQAGLGWAKDEAVSFYGRALELLPDSEPERRRDVTRRRAVAMQAAYHLTEMLAAAGRAGATSGEENLPE
jgi:predicted ATPase